MARWATPGHRVASRTIRIPGLVEARVHQSGRLSTVRRLRTRHRRTSERGVHAVHSVITVMTELREREKIRPPTNRDRPARPRSVIATSERSAHVKLSVMQENLARGLSDRQPGVSSRSTLPVLANVLLKTEDSGAQAHRHEPRDRDHLLGYRQDRRGRRHDVPARLLTDLVNSLPPGDKVELEVYRRRHAPREGRAVPDAHQGDRGRGVPGGPDRRRATDDADRPERPAPRSRRTAFAAASDEARPILTGVLARFEGDR